MGKRLVESVSNFSFHLDGESTVDAELLAKTISEMSELSKQAALVESPDSYVRLKVSAFKNGSFEVLFSAVCDAMDCIFDYTSFASAVTTIVVGFFEIKKHLKGKNPKKVVRKDDGVHIENCDGQIIVANDGSSNIINNITIDNIVTNVSIYANCNNQEYGFTVSSENQSVSCSPQDLQHMSHALPIKENRSNLCSRSHVTLAIKKPDLLGYSKWSFILNGRGIESSIIDRSWLSKVHGGDIVIRAHDYINAILETTIDVDESGVPIENTAKYVVVEVLDLFSSHNNREQTQL